LCEVENNRTKTCIEAILKDEEEHTKRLEESQKGQSKQEGIRLCLTEQISPIMVVNVSSLTWGGG